MIYVNQEQLDQVEYIIEQSTKGHHVLFDNEIIKKVFARMVCLSKAKEKDSLEGSIEKHIENLILQPTLLLKRTYLEKLSPEIFDRVVYTYFSIVENNISESAKYDQ